MDGKQRQKDFSDINVAWRKLDCIAYTNTVEAGISFEVTGHFDIVITITNIATPVHVKALAQMLYRIRDCPRRIVSMFYQKNSNELFRPPVATFRNLSPEASEILKFDQERSIADT